MFVVKKPFRNLGKTLTAGTVITEPAAIKRFNGRIAEGKVIEVTEQTYGSIAKYFKTKYGVTLPPLTKASTDEDVSTTEVPQTPDEGVSTAEVPQTPEVPQKPVEVAAKTAVKASVTTKA